VTWLLAERILNTVLDVVDLGREHCARKRLENDRKKAAGQSAGMAWEQAAKSAGPRSAPDRMQ
jgi:hypothetical protein